MKNKIFIIFLFLSSFKSIAQNKQVLFTINTQPFYTDEFERIYNKNLDLIKDDSQKDLNQYLELFLGYKLKVTKAYQLKLQDNEKYQAELASYRSQLSKTYLNDVKVTNKLVEEAYARSQKEIKASHILIKIDESLKDADTISYYNKALALKKSIDAGGNFEEIAMANSQDPSVSENKGNLGYFSAFRMVYPFESAAFKTEVGKVSLPVRTKFGYHLIYVTDKRDNQGEVTIAHIMMMKSADNEADVNAKAQKNINDVYKKIEQGEKFEVLANQFSEDKSSASKGGVLQKFGSGQLSSNEFEKTAFGLEKAGDVSKPFETQFGWHIAKLIEKHPVGKLEAVKQELENKIKRDERSIIITKTLAEKLKNKYKTETNKTELNSSTAAVTDAFYSQTWEMPKSETEFTGNILTINKDKKIATKSFLNYIQSQQKANIKTKPVSKLVPQLFENFKSEQLITYYTENLEKEFPEFNNIMSEYKDGLLLFDLMEQEIWNKSKNDTIGLQKLYEKNKSNYLWKKRYDIDVFSSTKKETIALVEKMLNENKSVEKIKETINVDGNVGLIVKQSQTEEGNDVLKKLQNLKPGVNLTDKQNEYYNLIFVKKIIEPTTKTFEEAKGKLTNDYQQYLESTWIDSLKKEFTYKINNDVFEKIKSKLKK